MASCVLATSVGDVDVVDALIATMYRRAQSASAGRLFDWPGGVSLALMTSPARPDDVAADGRDADAKKSDAERRLNDPPTPQKK